MHGAGLDFCFSSSLIAVSQAEHKQLDFPRRGDLVVWTEHEVAEGMMLEMLLSQISFKSCMP